jgi:maltose alpha-D-glucosyltransferase / alpha-amylase
MSPNRSIGRVQGASSDAPGPPGRLLLADANQWPEDVSAYFGDGDECHMAYNFPLMPRIYMAIAQEDHFPIIDILQLTPAIPANCQWALFLRNHDALTLDMVTDFERDYLWSTYAADPRARMNRGIRRRLAPLMDNDRRKIELMNSLLMSLPGSTLRRHVAPGAAPLLGRCRGRRPSPPPLDCAIP